MVRRQRAALWWGGLVATGLAAAALAGCGPPEQVVMQPGDTLAVARGRALYGEYCALCHGEAAQGYAADNASQLANEDFLASSSDGFLYVAIDRGRPGTPMAAYGTRSGGPLTSPQIGQLVAFLRSKQRGPEIDVKAIQVAGDAAQGGPLFAQHCAACHGDKGQGKTALSLNNPLFLATASDGYIRHAIEVGRRGTPMAAYGERLSGEQLDDLTRFVRGWATNVKQAPVAELPPRVEQLVIHPDGPAPSFSPLREGRFVPADEVKAALDGGARLVLLDARPTSDWLLSHIPGALPVPYYDATKMVDALPKDGTWIISYCGCPHAASGKVMDALRERGFTKTAVIDEGIFEWMRRGYPTTSGSDTAASGADK